MDGEHIILTLTAWLVPLGLHSLTILNAYRLKYKWRFSYSSKHEYLAVVGSLNSSHKGTHHVAIEFLNKILQNSSIPRSKIYSSSKPSHIISINYLDLDQAFATHKF